MILTRTLLSLHSPDISGKAVRGRQWQALWSRCQGGGLVVRWQRQCGLGGSGAGHEALEFVEPVLMSWSTTP